jgi:hypothetical protein
MVYCDVVIPFLCQAFLETNSDWFAYVIIRARFKAFLSIVSHGRAVIGDYL